MDFLSEMPERDAKYRYRSILAMIVIGIPAFGLSIWAAASLSWWGALPLGLVSIGLGFFVLLRIVNRMQPKKLPEQKDWW